MTLFFKHKVESQLRTLTKQSGVCLLVTAALQIAKVQLGLHPKVNKNKFKKVQITVQSLTYLPNSYLINIFLISIFPQL